GLADEDARLLLSDKHLLGTAAAWNTFVSRYDGNALALRLVGDAIREVFAGEISAFLDQVPGGTTFGGIRQLVASQLERLSWVEGEVLEVLALAREPVDFRTISTELTPRASRSMVLEAVEALRHRSLIESRSAGGGFTLQSFVMDCVAD